MLKFVAKITNIFGPCWTSIGRPWLMVEISIIPEISYCWWYHTIIPVAFRCRNPIVHTCISTNIKYPIKDTIKDPINNNNNNNIHIYVYIYYQYPIKDTLKDTADIVPPKLPKSLVFRAEVVELAQLATISTKEKLELWPKKWLDCHKMWISMVVLQNVEFSWK